MTHTPDPDTDRFIAAAVAGDENAFARIVVMHNAPMMRVCLAVVRDRPIAEEAVSRAWASAWVGIGRHRDARRLRTWLMKLAVDEALRLLKVGGRPAVADVAQAAQGTSGGLGPGTVGGSIDVRVVLERLDPDDRAPLAMRYLAGLDDAELAAALDMSASKVQEGMQELLASIRRDSQAAELDGFERRIAEELGVMAGPSPQFDALAIAQWSAAQAPRRRRARGRLLLVGLVVLAVAIAVVTLAALVSPPSKNDDAGADGTAGASAAPATPDPTAEPGVIGEREWSRLALPVPADAVRQAATFGPDGAILVVGTESGRAQGWLSSDAGATWTSTDLGLADPGILPLDATAHDGAFVVLARSARGDTTSVMTSADGITWQRMALIEDFDPSGMMSTGDDLVVHGYETEFGVRNRRYHPAILVTTDGTSWDTRRIATTRSPRGATDRTDLQLRGLARSDAGVWLASGIHLKGGIPGFIEVADPREIEAGTIRGLVWRSEDGIGWEPLALPVAPPDPASFEAAFVPAIAWAPSGFVMSVSVPDLLDPARGSLWHSDDGLAWEQVVDTRGAVVDSLVRVGRGVLAMGAPPTQDDEGVAVWTDQPSVIIRSDDGVTWERERAAALERLAPRDVSAGPTGRIVAVGGEVTPGASARSAGRAEIFLGEPG